jgi:hypothetical protein
MVYGVWACTCSLHHVTPERLTMQSQQRMTDGLVHTYSPKNGTMMVGQALRNPQAVVPAPPWCTTIDTCWKSHSCGQSSMNRTCSASISAGVKSEPSLLQPLEMIARVPDIRTASRINLVIAAGSSRTILPKPMYIGLVPFRRKSWISAGGRYCGGSRKKNPHTSGLVSTFSCNVRREISNLYGKANLQAWALELATNNK